MKVGAGGTANQQFSTPYRLAIPPRFRLPLLVFVLTLAFATATRLLLAVVFGVQGPWWGYLLSFSFGLFYDIAAASFFVAPLVLGLALLPNRAAHWRVVSWFATTSLALRLFGLFFLVAAEIIFWEEFGGRFNFIAVDYLIYTQEVIGNIWQSYPVGKILSAIAVVSIGLAHYLGRFVREPLTTSLTRRARLAGVAVAIGVPVLFGLIVQSAWKNRLPSDGQNELAGNGAWEFFAAAYHSDLDYLRLYRTLPDDKAEAIVRKLLAPERGQWRATEGLDLRRSVPATGHLPKLNVVLVSIESMGSEYVGSWGDTRGLTPNIDALTKESLVFGNLFATGNRTVRGLEALTVAIPPTPGQSIVKRPKNENLTTLGSIFKTAGYEPMFVYGGYGYFDNMNGYYAGNGYTVADRTAINPEKIHHENIWGVADEDLFDFAIENFDAAHAKGKPFFAHVMTTSNHRPYTYPDGRIDLPSGTGGRLGGVKYSDWSIGHLIEEARKRPWFDDTIFVITADHGANARGAGEIPAISYRIPVLFFAPKWIKPARHDRLASQIDIAPTLLGLLGVAHESKFMGYDLLRSQPQQDRAFVANYQTLGYLRDGRMVNLQPKRKASIAPSDLAPRLPAELQLTDEAVMDEAIAWYQSASLFFRLGYLQQNEAAHGKQ